MLRNKGLVAGIARRYMRRCTHLALTDLMAEGFLGMLHAASKFDPAAGVKFITYATHWIRQSCSRAVENDDQTIRVPIHVHQASLAHYKGRPLEAASLARVQAAALLRSPASLDAPAGHEDGAASLGDLVAAPGARADDLLDDARHSAWLDGKLSELRKQLGKRELAILDRRLLGGETLDQVAQPFGLSRERMRQIEVGLLKKLRQYLAEE